MKLSKYLLFLIVVTIAGCERSSETTNKARTTGVSENLAAFSLSKQEPDTVLLERTASFHSTDDVFIEGMISGFTVDDQGLVYISATQMGSAGIYVFDDNGEFITTFARYGRGPGEYEHIRSTDINKNKFYLLDSRLQKFGIFSLDDYSHIKDERISRDHLGIGDSLAHILNMNQLIVTNNEEHILKMRMIPRSREFASQTEVYYSLQPDGTIIPGKLLELMSLNYYYPRAGVVPVPFLMPFSRSQLVSTDRNGYFYTAWTEEFLINVYDDKGIIKRALYYPVENAPLSMNELHIETETARALRQYKLPETWPALHTMELDDEGKIWVSVITESDSTFQWWVLENDGELTARFTLPGKRARRWADSKPLIIIKNGYFYMQEQNFNEGIDRIVKYRIVFQSN